MKKYITFAYCIFLLLFLSACFALPIEDPVLPMPVTQAPTARPLRTFTVTRGDVRLYSNLSAFNVPTREERLSFAVDGFTVLGIFVDVGDVVQKGDIIAVLEFPAVQAQLQDALREEEWIRLGLNHVERRHALALRIAEATGKPVDNAHYLAERTYLQQQLRIVGRHIDYLLRANENRYLLAPIDGTITSVVTFYEGMTSNTLRTVAVIADQAQTVFVVRGIDGLQVSSGDRFTLTVNQEPFLAEVIDPVEFGIIRHDELGSDIYLTMIDDGILEPVGSIHGTIHVERETAQDVLFIPLTAINRSATRTFVYVITDGVRTVRDVEIGLWGNNALEITSGLEEGEIVVNE